MRQLEGKIRTVLHRGMGFPGRRHSQRLSQTPQEHVAPKPNQVQELLQRVPVLVGQPDMHG